MQLFQIVFVGDVGNNKCYKWDHVGDRASTEKVLRWGHQDDWYGDDSYVGYDHVIESNYKAIQQFASSNDLLCQIVVPFGTVIVAYAGTTG